MGTGQSLTVPGRYDQIQVICEFVSAGAREAGLNADTIFHIELCCDEATTNIIEHAYGAEDRGDITASYVVREHEFRITLHDGGQPFNPEDVPEPQLPRKDSNSKENAIGDIMASLKVGGLGMHFIRQLMDEVHYSFNGEHGNTLVLVKKINGETEP
jgi:anti-sigma regulatory factor (Ser/Thr protein kinase)